MSDLITLPANNGNWDLRVGKDNIMYTYSDIDTNIVTVKLYDRNATLVNTLTTTHTNGWNNTYAVKDRYVLTVSEGGVHYSYMITPTTTNVITQSNSSYSSTPNDFFWWND